MSAPHEQIISIVLGFWQARAVAVATELGLPDLLADGPLDVEVLASRSGTNAAALFRLLRALESVGVFAQTSPRVFVNTATSECLRKDVAGSQRPLVLQNLVAGNGPLEGWNELAYAVRTGEPSLEKVYGYDYWELLRRNPQANAALNGAVSSVSLAMTPAVTAAYEWQQYAVIADIGGGIGTQLVSILDAAPSSRGILFDQPHLRIESISHPRLELRSGDFFESVPCGADAYLLRWVIHDWADLEAGTILRSVRRAMPPTAHLVLVEHVLTQGAMFDFGKWVDLQMLVSVAGRERTEAEYRALLADADFKLQNVIATNSPLSLLVATPA